MTRRDVRRYERRVSHSDGRKKDEFYRLQSPIYVLFKAIWNVMHWNAIWLDYFQTSVTKLQTRLILLIFHGDIL